VSADTENADTSTSLLDIVAGNGVPFRVLYLPAGTEGPNVHRHPATSDKATVEFYDRRFEHAAGLGQFVSNYFVATVLGTDGYGHSEGGINLAGDVDDWTVDAAAMRVVRAWLKMHAKEAT
jgi:hypothetical protein